jgi:heme-degrading monooxygenase HmoA
MFVILWEFEVKPGNEERFERVYGPEGAWTQLFQQDVHYRGTKLLRDVSRSLHFFTLDHWDFESAYRAFLARHTAAYQELDRSCADLTDRERHVFSGVPDPSADP